ncbi:MAG: N-formylglutamate deformylase [Beijerinckiaceae bacterium]|nr:N-formylglutamate deformylase [Beijerinckiaceae bacterium]MCZ8299101.1 N-formylglutamate deformylase [Beijerinckiaceae bacterium]
MTALPEWLEIKEGTAPLILSLPHTGTEIPDALEAELVSPWLSRKDADWWIDRLYAFAGDLGATMIRTRISRTVIDVNRDPSGQSLYPGMATTELCPSTTFDGEPLYSCPAPDAAEIMRRRVQYFDPYHAALEGQIRRLRAIHPAIVLYDCHSIRSVIPRLFEGTLPHLNLGTNSGKACAPALEEQLAAIGTTSPFDFVANGRFKGGHITRHHGRPEQGIHAVQMELACRAYLDEPLGSVSEANWPTPFDDGYAAPIRATLRAMLETCLDFVRPS